MRNQIKLKEKRFNYFSLSHIDARDFINEYNLIPDKCEVIPRAVDQYSWLSYRYSVVSTSGYTTSPVKPRLHDQSFPSKTLSKILMENFDSVNGA